MKKTIRILLSLLAVFLFITIFSITAFAITEDEVRQRVTETSREAVSGNVLIWFLCAIAFLKVSQKIDSFMSSLGINVGHTGGNMLAEAMIAARGVQIGKGVLGGGFGKGGGGGGKAAGSGGESSRFLSGGLAGSISRQFNKSAVSSATNTGGNVVSKSAFNSSMAKGGGFANGVIGSVAKGDINSMGSITGETASKAMTSYMGLTDREDAPVFSDMEIGGGRMMGMETSEAHPEGIQFGMYNTDKYMAPDHGQYDTVKTADGAKWYRQYAADTVERTPTQERDEKGRIIYNETVVQKLPPVPRRKDRV